jgi:hypothetical protein
MSSNDPPAICGYEMYAVKCADKRTFAQGGNNLRS